MSKKSEQSVAIEQIDGMIRLIRGVRVMLDRDLARIYGVPTFRFNEAIKRNRHRFPPDFMFQLTRKEFDSLTSQIAISKPGRGGRRTVPYAFTEHGALQAANVLRSQRAVQMSVFVIRAFVKMREALRGTKLPIPPNRSVPSRLSKASTTSRFAATRKLAKERGV